MAEHIDIMTPNVDECPYFTVNIAVNSVDLLWAFGARILYAAQGDSKFQRGDSFIVLSCGYFIPEGFRFYGYEDAGAAHIPVPVLELTALLSSGPPFIIIQNFGNQGKMRIPFPNYEFSIGTFCDTEQQGINTATWQLAGDFPLILAPDNPQISMVGVPAALDGLTFKVVPFFKVLHNFALTA